MGLWQQYMLYLCNVGSLPVNFLMFFMTCINSCHPSATKKLMKVILPFTWPLVNEYLLCVILLFVCFSLTSWLGTLGIDGSWEVKNSRLPVMFYLSSFHCKWLISRLHPSRTCAAHTVHISRFTYLLAYFIFFFSSWFLTPNAHCGKRMSVFSQFYGKCYRNVPI